MQDVQPIILLGNGSCNNRNNIKNKNKHFYNVDSVKKKLGANPARLEMDENSGIIG
jgi:hypothetical protein